MLILQPDNLNPDYIHFGNPVKNNIIKNGHFRHINYSSHYFSLNTIYINLNSLNQESIHKIIDMEENILNYSKKTKQQNIKQYLDEAIRINYRLLKISGLWETSTHCGLSFKFIHLLKN